jgi:plastocyanin
MKISISKIVTVLTLAFSAMTLNAQVQNVNLSQVEGAFETTQLTLTPGEYKFEIANNGVDREVGFVLVPEGKYDAANHIKEAYVTSPVANGTSSKTSVVSLSAGTYEYFCPLNPTPKYKLTVVENVKTVKLSQIPGVFETKKLKLYPGNYQFEIANNGVDHEVGFVLVPKGKYDAMDHNKEAYVTAPVANGTSSKTSIVSLTAGKYEYFCPLNPTKKYKLTVK